VALAADRLVFGFFHRVPIGLFLFLAVSILSYIVFRSQFLGEVRCDSDPVATVIYNNSNMISAITNIEEISYSQEKKLRTCAAIATAGGRRQKLTFVIDTSRRGQQVPSLDYLSGSTGPKYNRFSVSYRLAD
jgi:hypothetical protein